MSTGLSDEEINALLNAQAARPSMPAPAQPQAWGPHVAAPTPSLGDVLSQGYRGAVGVLRNGLGTASGGPATPWSVGVPPASTSTLGQAYSGSPMAGAPVPTAPTPEMPYSVAPRGPMPDSAPDDSARTTPDIKGGDTPPAPPTAGPNPAGAIVEAQSPASSLNLDPRLMTPAGQAMWKIGILRGNTPSEAVGYGPNQTADMARRGITLNSPTGAFEWNDETTAAFNQQMAARSAAESLARYREMEGQGRLMTGEAARSGLLMEQSPLHMLLMAGKVDPALMMDPSYQATVKQKVGLPLADVESTALAEAKHPGLRVAEGLPNVKAGRAPEAGIGTRIGDLFDRGSYNLTNEQKLERALANMTPEMAKKWEDSLIIKGLLSPTTGRKVR